MTSSLPSGVRCECPILLYVSEKQSKPRIVRVSERGTIVICKGDNIVHALAPLDIRKVVVHGETVFIIATEPVVFDCRKVSELLDSVSQALPNVPIVPGDNTRTMVAKCFSGGGHGTSGAKSPKGGTGGALRHGPHSPKQVFDAARFAAKVKVQAVTSPPAGGAPMSPNMSGGSFAKNTPSRGATDDDLREAITLGKQREDELMAALAALSQSPEVEASTEDAVMEIIGKAAEVDSRHGASFGARSSERVDDAENTEGDEFEGLSPPVRKYAANGTHQVVDAQLKRVLDDARKRIAKGEAYSHDIVGFDASNDLRASSEVVDPMIPSDGGRPRDGFGSLAHAAGTIKKLNQGTTHSFISTLIKHHTNIGDNFEADDDDGDGIYTRTVELEERPRGYPTTDTRTRIPLGEDDIEGDVVADHRPSPGSRAEASALGAADARRQRNAEIIKAFDFVGDEPDTSGEIKRAVTRLQEAEQRGENNDAGADLDVPSGVGSPSAKTTDHQLRDNWERLRTTFKAHDVKGHRVGREGLIDPDEQQMDLRPPTNSTADAQERDYANWLKLRRKVKDHDYEKMFELRNAAKDDESGQAGEGSDRARWEKLRASVHGRRHKAGQGTADGSVAYGDIVDLGDDEVLGMYGPNDDEGDDEAEVRKRRQAEMLSRSAREYDRTLDKGRLAVVSEAERAGIYDKARLQADEGVEGQSYFVAATRDEALDAAARHSKSPLRRVPSPHRLPPGVSSPPRTEDRLLGAPQPAARTPTDLSISVRANMASGRATSTQGPSGAIDGAKVGSSASNVGTSLPQPDGREFQWLEAVSPTGPGRKPTSNKPLLSPNVVSPNASPRGVSYDPAVYDHGSGAAREVFTRTVTAVEVATQPEKAMNLVMQKCEESTQTDPHLVAVAVSAGEQESGSAAEIRPEGTPVDDRSDMASTPQESRERDRSTTWKGGPVEILPHKPERSPSSRSISREDQLPPGLKPRPRKLQEAVDALYRKQALSMSPAVTTQKSAQSAYHRGGEYNAASYLLPEGPATSSPWSRHGNSSNQPLVTSNYSPYTPRDLREAPNMASLSPNRQRGEEPPEPAVLDEIHRQASLQFERRELRRAMHSPIVSHRHFHPTVEPADSHFIPSRATSPQVYSDVNEAPFRLGSVGAVSNHAGSTGAGAGAGGRDAEILFPQRPT